MYKMVPQYHVCVVGKELYVDLVVLGFKGFQFIIGNEGVTRNHVKYNNQDSVNSGN